MNDPNVEGVRQSALVGKVSLVNMGGGGYLKGYL